MAHPASHPLTGIMAALIWLFAWPGQAAEIEVADAVALAGALAGAEPGDVLLLAPGDYGSLELKRTGGRSGQPITLRSADPEHPASLAQVNLENVSHMVFEHLIFDYRFRPGDPYFLRVFRIAGSEDVTFRRLLVDGDEARGIGSPDDGFGYAYAIGVESSTGITIEDCVIRTFLRGILVGQSSDIVVRNNELYDLRSDGMNFAEDRNVLIAENHIHDFRTSPESNDHADMIQFWSSGTQTPSANIRILDNVLNSGHGPETQSIFMRNERVDTGEAGYEMFYRDIEIVGNVIINAHVHGITGGEADGLLIANNTLVQNLGSLKNPGPDLVWVPSIIIAEASRSVRVESNVTGRVSGQKDQPGWFLARNFHVQNRTRAEPGFYGTIFAGGLSGDPGELETYAPRRSGPLDGTGVGAPRLQDDAPLPPGPRH